MNATTRRRGVVPLLLGAAAALAVVVTMMIPGLTPFSPDPAAAADSACTVDYLALDPNDHTLPNPNKESPGSFGPAVVSRDIPEILTELDERRECGSNTQYDSALAAAHYYTWSVAGVTSIKVDMADNGLEKFKAQWVADKDLRSKALAELKQIEKDSTISLEAVGPGVPSLYMMPDGNGGVVTKMGLTMGTGTNLVFTHGDVVVRYRLDCGFQPNWPSSPPPNVPQCTGNECAPPPVCPPGTVGTWPNCEVPPVNPCPPGNENPECAPKSGDKKDYEYPEGKPPVTVTTPGTNTPDPVETTVTGPVVTDTATNDPGTETGGTAPDAEPPATTPTTPPVNEGGSNDGVVTKP